MQVWVLASMLCAAVCCGSTLERVARIANPENKLLLVSFDGFRWDYMDKAPDLDGFRRIREEGVMAKFMQPVFPTQTSPNHFTVATGLYPESHGVVHNCNYNASEGGLWSGSNFYSTLAVNEWWDNGAEPIWITAVKQGLRSGGNLFPGSAANMSGVGATFQVLETADTPTDEGAWHERIEVTMQWFTEENLDMVALYFEEPDITSHRMGPDDAEITTELMPLISRTIVHLLERVDHYGLTDNLNVVFMSDHGFQTVNKSIRGDEAISLMRYVDMSKVQFMFAYGPLALVEPVAGFVDEVYVNLTEGNHRMSVHKKQDLPERWHYKNNDRVTSIVVLADPGLDTYPIFPGFHVNAGDHGYDNDLVNMRSSFFAIGPSFKPGYVVDGFEAIHVYPLMCHLLDLQPAPNNGSLDVLIGTVRSSFTPLSSHLAWPAALALVLFLVE